MKKMTDSEFKFYEEDDRMDYFWCFGCEMWVKGTEHEDNCNSYCDDCYPAVLANRRTATYYEADEETLAGR